MYINIYIHTFIHTNPPSAPHSHARPHLEECVEIWQQNPWCPLHRSNTVPTYSLHGYSLHEYY